MLGTVSLSGFLAGCTDDTSEEIEGGSRDDDDSDDTEGDDSVDDTSDDAIDDDTGDDDAVDDATDDVADDAGAEDAEEVDDDDELTEDDVGEAILEIVDHELVVEEDEFWTDVFVAATVENSGDEASGSVELQADWYDEEGNYLDNSISRLNSLNAGDIWQGRVYYLGTNEDSIDDYEIEGEFDETPQPEEEGLTVAESDMSVSEDEYGDVQIEIEGLVDNETGEDQSYVEVIATIYNEDGDVLGDEFTNVTDLRDGETWSFNFEYFGQEVRDRADEVDDHEIFVTTSPF